ncbi:MAG TPA: tetratricopeptide repeat protein [Mucilaginibacter sp.]|nr:tetratricopeptide repeat protein [Mucilaginibacter sp.]
MAQYNIQISKARLVKYWLISMITITVVILLTVYKTNAFKSVSSIKNAALTLRANSAYQLNHWGDAGILYQQALTVSADQDKLKYNLANAYYQQGRYKEAAELYQRLLANKRDDALKASVWNNLGNTYYMEGQLFESSDAYKKALLLNDRDDTTRRNFLFVSARIQNLFRSGRSGDKKKDDKNGDGNKKNDTKSDDREGQKSTTDEVSGPYKVSDKQMNDLLKISKEHERVPNGSKKSSKQTTKTPANGPDY